MMKPAAAIAAAFVSTGALAQGYVSAGLGVSRIDVDCGAVACDKTDTAGKLTAGYAFGNGFAAELGYMSFGKASAKAGGVTGDVKVDGITVGAAYRAVLPEGGVSARFGVARMKAKVFGNIIGVGSATDSETTTRPYFGLGVDMAINTKMKLEFAADFSRAEYAGAKATVRALTAGLRYDF